MQIQVSLTLELPATEQLNVLSVDSLEPLVLQAGRECMKRAMVDAMRQYEQVKMAQPCPYCGADAQLLRSEGTDKRVLLTLFGRVELPLRRVRCYREGCRRRFRPAEALIRCLREGNITRELRQACILAGASWTYETAASVMHKLCGAVVSDEKLRQLTESTGAEQACAQKEQAAKLLELPTAEQLRKQHDADLRKPLARKEEREAPRPRRLLVGLDGGWVPCREQQGGMEGKVGVLASAWEVINTKRDRKRLTKRRYVATFGTGEELGELAYAACVALGGEDADEQVVLADGAEWIKSEADMHFPWSHKILDWPHVARAVHKAIRAARPGPKHRQLRRELHERLGEALWHGQVEETLRELRALRIAPEPNDNPEDVRVNALEYTISYLQSQWEAGWLGNYAQWKEAGYPVGSGMVERAVELVINRRMKKRGGRWCRGNADSVVALRVVMLNDEWEQASALTAAA